MIVVKHTDKRIENNRGRSALLHRRIHAVHIGVAVEGLEEVGDFFVIGFTEFRIVLRVIVHFRGRHVPSGGFERFGHGVEMGNLTEEPGPEMVVMVFFIQLHGLDIVGLGLQSRDLNVCGGVIVLGFDHAHMLEHPRD